jgi:hypothetical protein
MPFVHAEKKPTAVFVLPQNRFCEIQWFSAKNRKILPTARTVLKGVRRRATAGWM